MSGSSQLLIRLSHRSGQKDHTVQETMDQTSVQHGSRDHRRLLQQDGVRRQLAMHLSGCSDKAHPCTEGLVLLSLKSL